MHEHLHWTTMLASETLAPNIHLSFIACVHDLTEQGEYACPLRFGGQSCADQETESSVDFE
jgi:hypothetical protein